MKRDGRQKKQSRNDLILAFVLLFLAALGGIYLFFFRESGSVVKITVDGTEWAVYSLEEDRVVEIPSGESEKGYNRLVIRQGKAYVESASCPDGICAKHRAVFRDGESIICLPNRVVITVHSEKTSDAPDAVA